MNAKFFLGKPDARSKFSIESDNNIIDSVAVKKSVIWTKVAQQMVSYSMIVIVHLNIVKIRREKSRNIGHFRNVT